MAAIEQVIRVITNRSGAVSDVYSALASSTAISSLSEINIQHLPTGSGATDLTQNGTGATAVVLEGTGALQVVREGTGPTNVVREGTAGTNNVLRHDDIIVTGTSGFVTANSDGTITFANPQNIQLGDAHSYDSTQARNAATNVEWHVGDIAIIPGGSAITDTGFQYTAFIDSTNFRVANGWDTTNDESALTFDVGDTIQIHAAGTGVVAGSIAGGTDFVVTAIVQFGSTNQAQVTLNRGTFPADGVSPLPSNGDDIFLVGVPTQGATYFYTGTDQTQAGVTTDADWTEIVPQFEGVTTELASGSAIGTVAGTTTLMIPSFQNGTDTATGLGQINYTPAAGNTPASLTINGTSITVGGGLSDVTRNSFYYQHVLDTSANTAVTITIPIADIQVLFPANATRPTSFPASTAVYILGMKLFPQGTVTRRATNGGADASGTFGDYTFGSNNTSITISLSVDQANAVRQQNNGLLDVEIETLA